MLLNEIQKQQRVIAEQQGRVGELERSQSEMKSIAARLNALERSTQARFTDASFHN